MSADFDGPDGTSLLRTIEFLCGQGNFGYAGLDSHYRCSWRHGKLAGWIPLGADICRHTDLFFGLEKQLLDLQDEHGSCLTLPRVGVRTTDDEASKISVEVFWGDPAGAYHLIVHRLLAESEVELELLKQIRARRLAEENFQNTRQALVHRQTLLEIIMETLPVATAIFDEKRRYLFATRRWGEAFHLDCEPLIGQDAFAFLSAFPERQRQLFEATLEGLTTKPRIDRSGADDGDTHRYRWTHRMWRDAEEGRGGGVLVAAEDLTDPLDKVEALERENAQLRASCDQLAQFAAIMTHDLNAPLRSLLSAVDEPALPSEPCSERSLRAAVRDHVARVQTILAGMQDYAEALCLQPAAKPVNIRRLVSDILATLPGASSRTVTYALETEEITASPGLLDLVLRNLLENAIKHHDRADGRLMLSCETNEDAWRICIEDDGPGLPPRQRDAILNGERPNDIDAATAAGSGLGLSIVVRALQGIKGSLKIESEPQQFRGTRVIIRWPRH